MGHQVVVCGFCGDFVMEGHNDWECDCGAICSEATQFKWVRYPECPKCKNNRHVWKNQISGNITWHRFGCHTEITL